MIHTGWSIGILLLFILCLSPCSFHFSSPPSAHLENVISLGFYEIYLSLIDDMDKSHKPHTGYIHTKKTCAFMQWRWRSGWARESPRMRKTKWKKGKEGRKEWRECHINGTHILQSWLFTRINWIMCSAFYMRKYSEFFFSLYNCWFCYVTITRTCLQIERISVGFSFKIRLHLHMCNKHRCWETRNFTKIMVDSHLRHVGNDL